MVAELVRQFLGLGDIQQQVELICADVREYEIPDDVTVIYMNNPVRGSIFGGLLGPTFNFVFETQMEDLQDGDRFYYLSRTAGLNLLTQLEGNSFSELIHRNTNVEGLPADSFSRPDIIFNATTLHSWWVITQLPQTAFQRLDKIIHQIGITQEELMGDTNR